MIDTLLDADLKEWEEDCRKQDRFNAYRHLFPNFFRVWDRFTGVVSRYTAKAICQILGHDILIDDWYGPNSGGFYWVCRRNCGQGGKEIFY